jgi:hypothetical protein
MKVKRTGDAGRESVWGDPSDTILPILPVPSAERIALGESGDSNSNVIVVTRSEESDEAVSWKG